MFGFGRSAPEKAAVNAFALQLEQIGLSEQEAVMFATKLIDEVLSDLRSSGIDPYKATQGSEQILKEQFVSPRLAAGLTIEDIRSHWNRPLILVFGEAKLRELFNFVVVHIADQQGKDLVAAGNHYKQTFPRYGDPRKWDPTEKFNEGLTEKDADLFQEFAARVDAWRRKFGEGYFAVERYLYDRLTPEPAAIWVLRAHDLNNQECGQPVTPAIEAVMVQPLINPAFSHDHKETGRVLAVMASEHDFRMFTQQGCFTIHSDREPLERRDGSTNYLSKFVIPAEAIARFSHEIEVCGFRKGDIYPDLDNLALELKMKKGA